MQAHRTVAFIVFSLSAAAHAATVAPRAARLSSDDALAQPPIERPNVASSVTLLPDAALAAAVPSAGGSPGEASGSDAAPSEAAPPQAVSTAATPTVKRTTVFGLPQNMGPGDRILRAAAGAALVSVGAWGAVTRNLPVIGGHAMFAVSLLPFLTALTGYCPLYHLLGVENSF